MLAWGAGTVTPIVQLPADQTAPSLWGDRIVYLDATDGDLDVVLADLGGVTLGEITANDGVAQGWPRIFGDYVAYRNPGEVVVRGLGGELVMDPVAPGTGKLVLSAGVVAWEEEDAFGSTDVAWRRLADGAAGVTEHRAGAGRQDSVAVSYDWIAWIDHDDAGGPAIRLANTAVQAEPISVRVPDHDPLAGQDTLVELSIWTATPSLPPSSSLTVKLIW